MFYEAVTIPLPAETHPSLLFILLAISFSLPDDSNDGLGGITSFCWNFDYCTYYLFSPMDCHDVAYGNPPYLFLNTDLQFPQLVVIIAVIFMDV